MRTFGKVIRILDAIGRIDVIISSITMFGIVCVTVWGVITRYIIGNPAGWTGEISMAFFVWLTFFGLSVLARRGEIVNIEFLLQYLPKKSSFFVKKVLSTALLAICLGVMICLGFKLVAFSGARLTASLRIPFSYIYLAIPVGSIFTLYHVIRHAFIGPQYHEEVEEF